MRIVDLITTDTDKKFEPAARMAISIVEITQRQGSCTPDDLNNRGFTSAEITQHWHMAQSLAEVEIKLNKQSE